MKWCVILLLLPQLYLDYRNRYHIWKFILHIITILLIIVFL